MKDADTLIFDESQITSKFNYSHPKWGGACHPLTRESGRAILIIKTDEPIAFLDDITIKIEMMGPAFSLRAREYKGPQCIMQRTTGTISPGAHPGSYNGQDAYNDMLVVGDENGKRGERTTESNIDDPCGEHVGHDARSADNFRGGCNLEHSVVRRLMPIECERLQGMPDDWSKYGLEEDGKIYELSDSARYKIQGNGICTPFWRWLLKRISAQYERPATLGSLFDGQASFPMIWEEINGKGSAVWSSEIDKHASAVARFHFPEENNEGEEQ